MNSSTVCGREYTTPPWLSRKAEEKYQSEAGREAEVQKGRISELRAQAGAKLDQAAALIVERIVNN